MGVLDALLERNGAVVLHLDGGVMGSAAISVVEGSGEGTGFGLLLGLRVGARCGLRVVRGKGV